jgi:HK97 family phage major capsid protein
MRDAFIQPTKEKDMDIDTDNHLETKAGIPPDSVVTHSEMMRAFAQYKETNDERVTTIEKRGGDVLLEEKVERINSTIDSHQRWIDESNLKSARPALGAENKSATSFDQREHKSAFVSYMRNGETAGLRQLELKALSVGSNPDGGYVVPVEIEQQISAREIRNSAAAARH